MRKSILNKISCTVFLILIIIILPAISQDIKFEHISLDQGLSQNSVLKIFQDSRGFMWFGTMGGLNRYDGYEFIIFREDPDDSLSLCNNEVSVICEDQNGILWFGTSEGVCSFDPLTEKFARYLNDPNDNNSLSDNDIFSIYCDRSNVIWIGTYLGGLNKYNTVSGHFTHFKHDPENTTSISDGAVTSICEDDSGNFWISTSHGINKFNPVTKEFTHFKHEQNNPNSLINDDVWTINRDRSGRLWIGTMKGFSLFNPKTGQFKNYRSDPNNTNSLSHNFIWAFYEHPSGLFWIGTDGGINIFNPETENFKHYKHSNTNPRTISDDAVISVYKDRSGVLWFGTWIGGLNKLGGNWEQFKYYAHDPDNPNSIRHSSVQTIFKDSHEILWIGSYLGFNKLKKISGNDRYRLDNNIPEIIKNAYIKSVCEQENDYILWFGTQENGLIKYDPVIQKVTNFKYNPIKKDGISKGTINTVCEDESNLIWIGTQFHGIDIYNPEMNVFKHYDHDPDNPKSISHFTINVIFKDHLGNMWIGTEKGLNLFDDHKNEFIQYLNDPKDPNTLSNNYVTSIAEDHDGNLWIGTNLGFNKLDRVSGSFIRYTEKDGLSNNNVMIIVVDDNNYLWISTLHGLSRFNPVTKQFKNYDVSDGLLSNEFNSAGYCCDGEVFLGSDEGFYAFNPELFTENMLPPPVVVTNFSVLNRPVGIGDTVDQRILLTKSINSTDVIKLSYKENVFSFEFSALDFHAPERNQYAYMMEGFDEDWNYAGNRRFATYTNLSNGEYIFRVKASNNEGIWNEQGDSIKIIITPPWWKTRWTYFIFGIIVISMIYIVTRFQLNRQKLKHDLEIRQMEADKLKELDHLKSRFFANISHEFRTPLTLILGPVGKLLNGKFKGNIKNQYNLIIRNAHRLLRLVNQLMDLSKLESGNLKLEARPGNLIAFLKGIIESFDSLAETNEIKLTFHKEKEDMLLYYDPEKIEKIFINLLSNAFKFTPTGGSIGISVNPVKKVFNDKDISNSGDFIQISICDTGKGIPNEQLPYIFDRFYQADNESIHGELGSGIGLALTKELISLHHGFIEVRSELGKGTEFIVYLPLGKNHLKADEIIDYNDKNISEETAIAEDSISLLSADQEAIISNGKKIILNSKSKIILTVEDNKDMRSYICSTLNDIYIVLEAVNGDEGFEKAIEVIPDLIISDVMMPGTDGYRLCQNLKTDERTSHIPVILLTAMSSEDCKIEGLQTGADDYLVKPFDSKELLVRVNNLIEQRQKLKERFSKEVTLQPAAIAITPADEVFLNKIMQKVEERMSDPEVSVEWLADEIGLSRSQLHRKLQGLTNQSATEFIRTFRLKRAIQLLEQDAATISEIAYTVGFSSPIYFGKCFREQFGMSPTEYKSRHSQI